jgi:hypothetical protein
LASKLEANWHGQSSPLPLVRLAVDLPVNI